MTAEIDLISAERRIHHALWHPALSPWLKDTLRSALEREPLALANDLELLAHLLRPWTEAHIAREAHPGRTDTVEGREARCELRRGLTAPHALPQAMPMMRPTSSDLAARPARRHSLQRLVISLVLAYGAAAVGAVASIDAAGFYAHLVRPAWAPPGWLFGPVWTVLYGMMGLALWRVWCVRPATSRPLLLFFAQLVVNAAWSWLFFRLHLGAASFVWIVLLAGLIGITANAFWRVSRTAGALLLPYLAWVLFACALSWAVWRANPAALG